MKIVTLKCMLLLLQAIFACTAIAATPSTESVIRQCEETGLGELSLGMFEKLNAIDDVGLSASEKAINSMCEQMFLVGQDLFVIGVNASGAGYASTRATQCYIDVRTHIDQKINSLTFFKRRCQDLVNKHPILLTGGCDDDEWCDKYYFGYLAIGLAPAPWKH